MLQDTDIAELDALGDRQAIRDTIHRYSRGIDRHDIGLIDSIFFADGIDNHGDHVSYRAEFAAWGNALHENIARLHGHYITTHLVSLHGIEAGAETYVVFVNKRKDLKTVHIGGARYLDRLEKRAGLWRIVMRRVTLEWRSDVRQADPARNLASLPGGTWDREDPSYAIMGG